MRKRIKSHHVYHRNGNDKNTEVQTTITIRAGAELGRLAKASFASPVERSRQQETGLVGFLNSKLVYIRTQKLGR